MDLRLESEDKDRKLVNIYRNILKINSIYYFCFIVTIPNYEQLPVSIFYIIVFVDFNRLINRNIERRFFYISINYF